MRVLHVISAIDPRAGGTVAALTGLTTAQAEAGLRPTVVTSYGTHDRLTLVETLRQRGVGVELIGPTKTKIGWHPRMASRVRELVAAHDVVHIHALWEEIQHRAARVAAASGKPFVISPHGMLDPWSLNQGKLKKRVYLALRLRRNLNRAAALAFTTQTEAGLVRPLGLRPPGIVEPLGVDLTEFTPLPSADAFRSRYPAIDGKPVIMFLSRVHPKKGLDLLIPAFAQCTVRDAVLVIAGPDDGGYGRQVRELAQRHGVAERVVFTGMLFGGARIEALAAADLFVLPSYQENFGIAVVEAMAAGLPVVISDQVNIHHEITRAGVGAVVPTRVEPLAEAMSRFMGDRALRARVGAEARKHAHAHFGWRAIGERWVGHYARLVGEVKRHEA